MKTSTLSAFLAIVAQTNAFAPSTGIGGASTGLFANVLEGKEIEKDFTPINNMLLVKKVEVVDQTEGGLFLTGKVSFPNLFMRSLSTKGCCSHCEMFNPPRLCSYQQKIVKSEGEVTAAGTGRINSETGFQSPMPLSVGDAVSFGKFSGEEVTYNGDIHTLIRDDDVLVRFPGGADKTMENAEVIWDNVLVKVQENEIEETGGLLIAATTKKATVSSVGEVMKVGPGRLAFNGELMEMDVMPGDMVKFRDFAAQEVEIDGEDYAVIRMVDLLAKF